jgi:hypothetical protein
VRNVPTIHNAYWSDPGEARAVPVGDIGLEVEPSTGLVVNSLHDPKLCRYDSSYTHDQYTSAFLSEHMRHMVALVASSVDCSHVHEIGAGNGLFAAALAERGVKVSASDPSVVSGHSRVVNKRFEDLPHDVYSALVLRHVLEHIPSPFAYMVKLKTLQQDCGSFFLEFPSWDYIVENDAWFDVTYEHVNYFGEHVSRSMFNGECTAGRVARGQYMYVTGKVSNCRGPEPDSRQMALDTESISRLSRARSSSQSRLSSLKSEIGAVVVWGAAQKGSMIAHAMGEVEIPPDFIVDVDPRKHGKFLGGGYPISSPDVIPIDKTTAVIIANSNYISEIRKITDDRCRYFVLERELTEV